MERFFYRKDYDWYKTTEMPVLEWECGFCSHTVCSDRGYKVGHGKSGEGNFAGGIFICPRCNGPTFCWDGKLIPSPAFGRAVKHVPDAVESLYEEARRCTSQRCFTGAILLCRKLLMNIAHSQGAAEGLRFIEYVDYLANNGYVPPNGRQWVDHIRKKGNEATHEIPEMNEDDAMEIVNFSEMLLTFIYDFPARFETNAGQG